VKIGNIHNDSGGQINNIEEMVGDIHFSPNVQTNTWQHAETIVREYGSPAQLSDLHTMRRKVEAGDTVSARTIWMKIQPVFDVALARGANVAQIVSTIAGFLHHAK
jgi:hypothetical protein